MKKLVIVSDTWHPQINGVVTVLDKMKELLEKKGFAVTIIHPGLFMNAPLFFDPEIRLTGLPLIKIKRLLIKENPDFIHIATEAPLGLAARIVCVRNKFKFTTSYHTHFSQYSKVYLGALFETIYAYMRWFHNAGENTMVASQSLKQELEKHDFKNVVIWPLGVDVEMFTRNPDAPDRNLKKPVFVYFGRVAAEKSPEEFLKCRLSGTKLVIGDGPLREKLEKTYGKSAVFVGYKKGKELVDWLSICDVFAFPSRTETFGLVAVESLAMGVPVAAHDVMGPRDIITNGVDGYLGENLEECAIKCLKLLPENCRKKALQFTWEKSADEFIRHLIKLS